MFMVSLTYFCINAHQVHIIFKATDTKQPYGSSTAGTIGLN
jgi:hypothetical protein